MKCKDINDLFEAFPQLKDMADRLEKSETEAKTEKLRLRKTSDTEGAAPAVDFPGTPSKRRGYQPKGPEYFLITSYRNKKGSWQNTVYSPDCGRAAFEATIEKCLNAYDPDAIKIKIFYATKHRTAPETNVYFKEDLEGAEEKPDAHETALKEQLDTLSKKLLKLEEEKGATKEDAGNLQLELKLIRKDHEFAMKEMSLKDDYQRKIVLLERQIDDLQGKLAEKEEEIEALNDELDDAEDSLGSVEEEYKKKELNREQHPLVPVLIDVGKGILAHDGVIDAISGGRLTAEAKAKLIKSLTGEQKLEAPAHEERGASASDVSGVDAEIAHLTKDHQAGLKNFWAWIKQMPVADFQVLYAINMAMTTQAGDLDKDIAKAIAEKIEAIKVPAKTE